MKYLMILGQGEEEEEEGLVVVRAKSGRRPRQGHDREGNERVNG